MHIINHTISLTSLTLHTCTTCTFFFIPRIPIKTPPYPPLNLHGYLPPLLRLRLCLTLRHLQCALLLRLTLIRPRLCPAPSQLNPIRFCLLVPLLLLALLALPLLPAQLPDLCGGQHHPIQLCTRN